MSKILSKHIIPQPLVKDNDTNKYILNENYNNILFATSDLNGYTNTKYIEQYYNNTDISEYLNSYYYIPTISELGLAFQNINKINQNSENDYLDKGHSKVFLSSTTENIINKSFWIYDNKYGNILPYSNYINKSDNIYTVFFKKFDSDTLIEQDISSTINNDENINYINNFEVDNVEVLSYMYYTNYNSTNLENNPNCPYYFMQYRMAYSYLIEESEPLFSYWLYGNNTINDFSENNMSYIYDQYEKTIGENGVFTENQNNIHNNFFDIKNPPTGTYIFPISYNINNVNNKQEVTININPYAQYVKDYTNTNITYFDPYGFKFYFILPFEYLFNKIKTEIKEYYKYNTSIIPENDYITYLKYSVTDRYVRGHVPNSDYNPTYYYVPINNGDSMVKLKFINTINGNKFPGSYKPTVNSFNTLEFSEFTFPFRLSELLLFTFFTEKEINDMNIKFNYFNISANCSPSNIYQEWKYASSSNPKAHYEYYLKENISNYTSDSFILNYDHGKTIRQYIKDHYLQNLSNTEFKNLGKKKPIIQSLEMFLDLFGSIFYKSSATNYQYNNFFAYSYIYNNNHYSNYQILYAINELSSNLSYKYKTIYYYKYENDDVNYVDNQRKRFYNISPIKYKQSSLDILSNNDIEKYSFNNILTLSMKYNGIDENNNFSLYYYTKDALIFICKKTKFTNLEKLNKNINSITFSLFFGSNNKDFTSVINNLTIIHDMTFNIYFDTKNIYRLLINNEKILNNNILNHYNFLSENNSTGKIENNGFSYYFIKDNIDINTYLSQFSNINHIITTWNNSHYISSPRWNGANNAPLAPNTTAPVPYKYIYKRINSLANYYNVNYQNNPISHKIANLNNDNSWMTYIHVETYKTIAFTSNYDYPEKNNNSFYQTYYIDNILKNSEYIDNSNFAKEIKTLPKLNTLYNKNLAFKPDLDTNIYKPILRIWGHRNLNNIYDDYTIYNQFKYSSSKTIKIPSLGYKEVLYIYNVQNTDIINYLLSDYIIIVNKTNQKYNIKFKDTNKLSILSDLSEFDVIINPFEFKILYPAVYNFNYDIEYSCNSDANIYSIDIYNFIKNDINTVPKMNNAFEYQDIIYLLLKKLNQIVNIDLDKINNYNNIISKLDNTNNIDKLINQLIYNTQTIDNPNKILTIKHCQNPFKGNIIYINEKNK